MQHSNNYTAGRSYDESFPGLQEATLQLLDYCRSNDWAGYDPYDALNSKLFEALPFLNSRTPPFDAHAGLEKISSQSASPAHGGKNAKSKGLSALSDCSP